MTLVSMLEWNKNMYRNAEKKALTKGSPMTDIQASWIMVVFLNKNPSETFTLVEHYQHIRAQSSAQSVF